MKIVKGLIATLVVLIVVAVIGYIVFTVKQI